MFRGLLKSIRLAPLMAGLAVYGLIPGRNARLTAMVCVSLAVILLPPFVWSRSRTTG